MSWNILEMIASGSYSIFAWEWSNPAKKMPNVAPTNRPINNHNTIIISSF
jgi:hypothetical protein